MCSVGIFADIVVDEECGMSSEILIVEDERDIADVIEFVLQQDGYKTTIAADGDEAARLFSSHKPDLVVLDLSLPGISGIELFHRFRGEAPGIPIIIATSRSEESDRIAGLEMAKLMGKDVKIDGSYYEKMELLKSKPGQVYTKGKVIVNESFRPIIHCVQEIPCNPCVSICPSGSIRLKR